MSTRKPLDTFAVVVMLSLCLLWGLQQVAVKIAAPYMGPIMQIGLRSLIAALLLCTLMAVRRERPATKGTLLPGMAAGGLFTAEFLVVALGLEYTTASHMSVFLYTAPIFVVLGLHWLVPSERLGPWQWAGVLAAFGGIAVAFSEGFMSPSHDLSRMLIGDALGVLAGVLWAATTLVVRSTSLSETPPATTLLYQLGSAGVLLSAIAAMVGQASGITMNGAVWGSLFFQSVIIAFASFLVWFWMLRKYLASRLSVFSFLSPMFGVGFGVLLLHDPIDARFAIGAALVMAGVVMVNLPGLARKAAG